jgi:hypothetical protein
MLWFAEEAARSKSIPTESLDDHASRAQPDQQPALADRMMSAHRSFFANEGRARRMLDPAPFLPPA